MSNRFGAKIVKIFRIDAKMEGKSVGEGRKKWDLDWQIAECLATSGIVLP